MARNDQRQLSRREIVEPNRGGVQLQVARPVVQAPVDNQSAQIANALGFFAGESDRLTKRARAKAAEKGQAAFVSGMSYEEAAKHEGLENSEDFYRSFMAAQGQADGFRFREQLLTSLQNPEEFNPNTDDFTKFVQTYTSEHFKGYDPVAMQAASGVVMKAHADAFSIHQQRAREATAHKLTENTVAAIRGNIAEGSFSSPEAFAAIEGTVLKEFTPQQRQDLYMQALAAEAAEGNEAAFEQFEHQWNKNFPPLARGSRAQEFSQLKARAKAVREQKEAIQKSQTRFHLFDTLQDQINEGIPLQIKPLHEKIGEGLLSEQEAWSWYQKSLEQHQGMLDTEFLRHSFEDNTWHMYTGGDAFTRDQVQKEFDRVIAQAGEGWISEAVRLSRINGLTSTRLKNRLNSTNVQVPEQMLESAGIYRILYEADPRVARNYVTDDDTTAMYMGILALRDAGMSEAAVVEKLRVTDHAANRETFRSSTMRDQLNAAISSKQFFDADFWSTEWNLNGNELVNSEQIRNRVRTLAEALGATGFMTNPDQILQHATELVARNTIVSNGVAYPSTAATHPDAQKALDWFYREKMPLIREKLGADEDEQLYLRPDRREGHGHNTFTVYRAGDYVPLDNQGEGIEPVRFTLQDIVQVYTEAETGKSADAYRQAAIDRKEARRKTIEEARVAFFAHERIY